MSISPTPAAKPAAGSGPYHLGLDFGTSGARACVVDRAGVPLFQHHLLFTHNTWQEWQAVLQQLLEAIPPDMRRQIAEIAFCATSSTVLLCGADGQPLLPALLYNDQRAQAEAALLPAGHITASASSSLAKLHWLMAQPAARQARHLMHQADWLAFLLHGIPGISDYHNSLKLGYDLAALRYPDHLVPAAWETLLPRVLEPGTDIAAVSATAVTEYALPPHCRVRAGTTDSIAAYFASGACEPGQAVTSLGSTLVLKLLSETRVEMAEYGIYSHRCGDHWLAGGASNCGGALLERLFGKARLQELSSQLDPTRPTGLDYYPLPAIGERFPINDPALAPRLEPRPQDDARYLQGLLESLARIEAQGYVLLQTLGATPLRQVFSAGGGASNAAWTEIRARTMGVPVAPAPHTEAAYGAALLAMHGTKLLYSNR